MASLKPLGTASNGDGSGHTQQATRPRCQAGNVYVIDAYPVEGVLKSYVIQYDTDGNELWRRQIHFPTGTGASAPPSTPIP